jgi:PAS domain S-box-containing protein
VKTLKRNVAVSIPITANQNGSDPQSLRDHIRMLEMQLSAQTEELFRLRMGESILSCSLDLVFAVDADLHFTYANPITLRFGTRALMCSAAEFMSLSLDDIARSEAMKGSDMALRRFRAVRALFEKPGSSYFESNVLHENELIWLGIWLLSVCDERNKVTAVVGMARNITEQKRTEAALAAERERLTVTLSSVTDAVVTTDTEGRITSFNDAAEKLTGSRSSEVLGQLLEDIVPFLHEVDHTRITDPLTLLLYKQRSGNHFVEEMDAIVKSRTGAETPVTGTAALILQGNRECIGAVLVLRDISRQKAVEEEMHRVQKLESVGLLAGGIAHDFNNILTSVMGNLSLAQRKKNDDFLLARLKDAEKAVIRAQGLTNQLLTFSKGGAPNKTPVSVQRIIEDSAAFSLIGSAVRRVMSIPDDLWSLEVDEGQISQVIQNLVINADQAMPNGGTVYVSAENRRVDGKDGLPIKPGQYVIITVVDEGIGIPACHLDKVFDPYFTTKKNGTGLGLATTHSIIRRHGGHITVQSEEGAGSCFSLYLPATEERISRELISAFSPLKGKGRILVMDDESAIRDVVKAMLFDLGFQAESAADGEEAVAQYIERRNEGNPFDAVIVDLTIPGGMGGRETLARLKAEDPEARVIVSSGYSNDPAMSEYKELGFAGRVTKPYGMEQLAAALRKVIS